MRKCFHHCDEDCAYLCFRWVSAALEFDCSVRVRRVGTSVLIWKPRIAKHADVDAWHDCMRLSVLATTASERHRKQ